MTARSKSKTEFDAALAAVRPDDDAAWDRLEDLAGTHDRPDEVAAAYRDALGGKLDPAAAEKLGQRAARFAEEWFGQDSPVLGEILIRVVELDPRSEWAFQRLSVLYTVSERWADLLALYDRAIASTEDKAQKLKLYEEAYQAAKDMAGDAGKAIQYLGKLYELDRGGKHAAALERLLEKHERWRELIDLWEQEVERKKKGRAALRLKIATGWLDRLGDPGHALEVVRLLFAEPDRSADDDASALLERVITSDQATPAVRDAAVELLRTHYEATGRAADVVRVLQAALPLAGGEQQKEMHRAAAQRLSEQGQHAAALGHWAELLLLDPGLAYAQRGLRQAAQAADDLERYATAVAAAAAKCTDAPRKVSLLADAARTRSESLDDDAGAIELYQAALAEPGIPRGEVLTVGRRLEQALGRAERNAERLAVLEKLADAETVASSQRALIGDVARLAEDLGEVDRALAAWRRRLDADPSDGAALSAIIDLLDREGRHKELIDALERRVTAQAHDGHKRADLVRIARLTESELEDVAGAIAAWSRVKHEHGPDDETVSALVELLTRSEDWRGLAELLEEITAADTALLADQLCRLGDAYREHLDAATKALAAYRRALDIDLSHRNARAGLVALLDHPECRTGAAQALGRAYRSSGDWPSFLTLTEARLASAENGDQALHILREVAQIEERIGQSEEALATVCRALPYAPKDRALEDEMVRLARRVGKFDKVTVAYRDAAAALRDDPHGAAQLHGRQAALLEEIGDLRAASDAFFSVLAVDQGNLPATQAVVRLGSRLGKWTEVATATIDCTRSRGRLEVSLLEEIENAAREAGSFDEMTRVLGAAIDQGGLEPRLAADLLLRLADWHRFNREDAAAAEAALRKATAADPSRVEALRALVSLQRKRPDRALLETLGRLADADPRDLDAIHEAAELAVDTLKDRELARERLTALLGRATAAWRGTAPAKSARPAAELAEWAVHKLVDLYSGGGRDDAHAALDLLVDASRLPFPPEVRVALRHRAAQIAGDVLGDDAVAIDMYRGILGQKSDDSRAIEALASLYRKHDRVADLLSLRQLELAQSSEPARRIALRLEVSRLIDELDRRGGRLEMLKANLADQPGHDESLLAVTELLQPAGRHRELHDLIVEQARRVETGGPAEAAIALWKRAAQIAERDLADAERAIAAHRKVIALSPVPESLDALARLHMERGEPTEAIHWLERGLVGATPARKAELSLELAGAHADAGRPDRAATALERAIAEGAGTGAVREQLAILHRGAERWEPLAQLLTDTLPLTKDDEAAAAIAREAAEIFHQRLGAPERAMPALERALQLRPDDKGLRAMMARSLRALGRHGDARTALEALIGDFGRRRTKERAALHIELAQVLRAEGRLDDAFKELEQASQMDVGNPHSLRLLAEVAVEAGKPEQAEKSLRALLLVVRRQPPGETDLEAIGLAEVSFELYAIARERDDEEKAAELLETALEAARGSDAEVVRLRRALIARKEGDLLLRMLDARLTQTTDPAMKLLLEVHAAEALDELLGRPADGLGRLLAVLGVEPGRIDLHHKARAMAQRADQLGRYVAAAADLLGRLRRKDEAGVLSRLAGELGTLAEEQLKDFERAKSLFEVAHKNSEDPSQWLFAIARVCGELGDEEGRLRALDELAAMATDDNPTPAHADALYRLAQVQVESPELLMRGLELIERALRIDARPLQAGEILRRAAETAPSSAAVLDLYETVARQSGDEPLLLDYLERRIARGGADPALIEEAVNLADAQGEAVRAERLLSVAVAEAREGLGLAGATWAAMKLARHRLAAGDLTAARDLLLEVQAEATPEELFELGLALASAAAAQPATQDLAVEIYEVLRDRDPGARAVWEPLADLYRARGDHDRLSALVIGTLPTLVERDERNAMRLQFARYLIEQERGGEAIAILREALLDEPDHAEAAALLEEVLVASGDPEALAEFLAERREGAKERRQLPLLVELTLRLGVLHDQMQTGQSLELYLDALRHVPASAALLRAVAATYDPADFSSSRIEHLERLLTVEEVERTPALALELAGLYESIGEDLKALTVLERGVARASNDADLHARLEQWYRHNGMWRELAILMLADAERTTDVGTELALLRGAAELLRDTVGDMKGAAAALSRALRLAPGDVGLIGELVGAHVAAGAPPEAIVVLDQALAGELPRDGRVDLLLTRGNLLYTVRLEHDALADLEAAFELDPERAGDAFRGGLDAARLAAFERGDRAAERDATMKLARLLAQAGHEDHTRELLVQWIEREPEDAEPLYIVRDMDVAASRWDGVTAVCARLVLIETDEAQLASAIQLAEAAEKAGIAAHAQPGLEHVHRAQPEAAEIRDLLRRIYQQAGSWRELASLLLSDAEHAADDQARYQCYRQAADILVNRLGDTVAAVEPAQKARELRPDDHDTQLLVADLHIASGQIQEAVELLLPAIEAQKRRSPELAALQLRMSRAAAATGDKDTQLAWLKRAFDVDRKDGTIAAELAQLATEMGDYELALKPLRAITLNDTQGPITRVMALLWEAKIEHARGNKAKAELWAKKALREDPAFAEAEEFLSALAAEPA